VLIADGGEIEPDDLGLPSSNERGLRLDMPDTLEDLPTTVGEVTDIAERRMIERALEAADGNRTHAARALGISRRTLLYKLKKLGIAG
jgi:DNA-binding NtrC family response regulator